MQSVIKTSDVCSTFLFEFSRGYDGVKGYDGDTARGKCLFGHMIKEITVSNARRCCMACIKVHSCRSINVISDWARTMCQLNNVNSTQVDPESFLNIENCIFYE